MPFETDKQTLTDLDLLHKIKGERSVFSLFNHTRSLGGRNRLTEMFSAPITDKKLLEKRVRIIHALKEKPPEFEIDKEKLDFIEYYLTRNNKPVRFSLSRAYITAFKNQWKSHNEYYIVQRGVRYITALLLELEIQAEEWDKDELEERQELAGEILRLIKNKPLSEALKFRDKRRMYPYEIEKLDFSYRTTGAKNLRKLLDKIYQIDAYMSVNLACNLHRLVFPTFTDEENVFEVTGLYHPLLENPVSNDISFLPGKNVCFITGPNMAGKSTFLKALGISVYLAHIGFPVPAGYMKTSLLNGLFTTINYSDDLSKGFSHFYNEVMRVKNIAEKINAAGNVFIVFDELFRSTNVKDAYEASLAVISEFAKLNSGMFAVSSHMVEIAEKLVGYSAVFFRYFEAMMVNGEPHFTYRIKEGVTSERIGMFILNREKVIETIRQRRT